MSSNAGLIKSAMKKRSSKDLPKPRNAYVLPMIKRGGAGIHEEDEDAIEGIDSCSDCGNPRISKFGLCPDCLIEATDTSNKEE